MRYTDTIGQHIRALREAKGFSQEYMADMLEISQSTYACLESGKTSMRLERLFKVLEILETDIGTVLADHLHAPAHHQIAQPAGFDSKPQAPQDVIHVYEQLVGELKNEIEFLKDLIRNGQKSTL